MIASKLDKLKDCFMSSNWHNDWSLSLFTHEKYAGYKDEERIIPYHKDNSWAKAYKAEYDSASNSLISNPALNPQQVLP